MKTRFGLLLLLCFVMLVACMIPEEEKKDDIEMAAASGAITTRTSMVGIWKSTLDDEIWAYDIRDNDSIYYCAVKAKSKVADAKGTLTNKEVTWAKDKVSQFSLSGNYLKEDFGDSTTYYSESEWPKECDQDPFVGVWSATSGTKTFYYEITSSHAVNYCLVESSKKSTSATGNYKDHEIIWSATPNATVNISDSKLVEVYKDQTTEYSKSTLPSTCK